MVAKNEKNLQELVKVLEESLEIKDRKYLGKTYERCFVGSDLVEVLIKLEYAKSEWEALAFGNMLMDCGVFKHVTGDHNFKDEKLFYRFSSHSRSHGSVAKRNDGSAWSWSDYLAGNSIGQGEEAKTLQAKLPDRDIGAPLEKSFKVTPVDDHNIRLLDAVHPAKWVSPEPLDRYNLVVIGAGSAGLVTAAGAAGVGAKVALIEENLMGGDCLNFGCVPSKALIRAAKAAYEMKNGHRFGIESSDVSVDFSKVMERIRKLRADISKNDSAKRFSEQLGVDLFIGKARFASEKSIEVDGKILNFSKAVIASGASPAIPSILGIEGVDFHTNLDIFNLTELPETLGVIGGGPIGLELAQAMARLGSKVYLFARGERILDKEDWETSQIVKKSMEKDGVSFILGGKFKELRRGGGNRYEIIYDRDGESFSTLVDKILVATGRAPNVASLDLEKAKVDFDKAKGILVDEFLQTSNKNIYAAGDCCTAYKFTHVADFMARIAIRNALFFGREKVCKLIIPWSTYTDPEVAHVGLYEKDLRSREIQFDTFRRDFSHVDRAVLDDNTEGWVKVFCEKDTDKILGATIVGPHAGDMISELTLAMQNNIGLSALASVIHPYPTNAEAIRQIGDLYNKERLTPAVKVLFRSFLQLRR